MPIEIRELVIRATISPGVEPPPTSDPSSPSEGGAAALDVEAIVQECVRQVLRVLAREAER